MDTEENQRVSLCSRQKPTNYALKKQLHEERQFLVEQIAWDMVRYPNQDRSILTHILRKVQLFS